MTSKLFACLLLVSALSSWSLSAQETKKEEPKKADVATTDYFPLKAGAKWVYKVNEAEIEVVVAELKGSEAKLETKAGNRVVASEKILIEKDGVYRTAVNNVTIEPKVKILDLKDGKPNVKGTKWEVNSTIQGKKLTGSFEVKETVKLKLPIAPETDMECVPVEGSEFTVDSTKTQVRYWFAAGKGIVKLSYNIQGNEAVLELKSYDPGK